MSQFTPNIRLRMSAFCGHRRDNWKIIDFFNFFGIFLFFYSSPKKYSIDCTRLRYTSSYPRLVASKFQFYRTSTVVWTKIADFGVKMCGILTHDYFSRNSSPFLIYLAEKITENRLEIAEIRWENKLNQCRFTINNTR